MSTPTTGRKRTAAFITAATMSAVIAIPGSMALPVFADTANPTQSIVRTSPDASSEVKATDAEVNATDAEVKATDYSLAHITENYTYFGKGNFEGYLPGAAANHQVGPVAVGGDAHISNIGTRDVTQNEYSFVAGTLTEDSNIQEAKDGTVILGTVNKGNGKTYSGVTPKYIDGYIDFDKAFGSINNQVDTIINDNSINWNPIESVNPYWANSVFSFGKAYKGTINNLNLNQISFTGSEGGDTVICITDEGALEMPMLQFGLSPSQSGSKSGIVWLFPNVTDLHLNRAATPLFGTVVLPKGNISIEDGNFNGCLIVGGNGNIGAEGHLWSYSGTVLPSEVKENGENSGSSAETTEETKGETTKDSSGEEVKDTGSKGDGTSEETVTPGSEGSGNVSTSEETTKGTEDTKASEPEAKTDDHKEGAKETVDNGSKTEEQASDIPEKEPQKETNGSKTDKHEVKEEDHPAISEDKNPLHTETETQKSSDTVTTAPKVNENHEETSDSVKANTDTGSSKTTTDARENTKRINHNKGNTGASRDKDPLGSKLPKKPRINKDNPSHRNVDGFTKGTKTVSDKNSEEREGKMMKSNIKDAHGASLADTVPKTGDNSNLITYLVIGFGAGIALIFALLKRIKTRV